MLREAPAIAWPSRDGSRVPFEVFTRADVFAREQEAIFRGPVWNYVALEAELPEPSDFKTSFVGDTPIIVSRAEDGSLHAFVNRCAHRGATVQRQACGNARQHRCVYHQWAYNARGELVGVPYRRGVPGMGGYAADFDPKAAWPRQAAGGVAQGRDLRDASAPTPRRSRTYLDEPLLAAIDRLFSRPVKVLGHMRQRVRGNWKLYSENTRDPYHAALLHGFHATFGLYRTNQKRNGRQRPGAGAQHRRDLRRRLAPGRAVRQHRAGQVRRQLFAGRSFAARRPARLQRRRDGVRSPASFPAWSSSRS